MDHIYRSEQIFIYLSYTQAHDVWEELRVMGIPSVIAPPFYMGGVQALTRHFPGTFAFSKETIMACIEEYLENLAMAESEVANL